MKNWIIIEKGVNEMAKQPRYCGSCGFDRGDKNILSCPKCFKCGLAFETSRKTSYRGRKNE